MGELHERSALELATAIREGEVASREVLDHLLDRIEKLDGPINAVVTLDRERAVAEAKRADDATARGDDLGPLHGVPITVKDAFSTAGMRTTSGAPMLAEHIPDTDAAPVAALRRAGCIVFGKTNLPMFAGDMQTYNDVFGVTNNPYDLDRTPGGSSGGAGAALACGFTPLELGSDIGGSIRIPAHMCGVVGHKPSHGIVPSTGHIPGPPGSLSAPDLFVAGPMARSVEDVAAALQLITGPDLFAKDAWSLSLPPAPERPIRLAAWFDDPASSVDAETAVLLEAAAAGLADRDTVVDFDARPEASLEETFTLFDTLLQGVLSAGNQTAELDDWATLSGTDPLSVQQKRRSIRHADWLRANESRQQMRLRWHRFFETWDAILMPVVACPAIAHNHSQPSADRVVTVDGQARPYRELLTWMAPAGACLLPSTVVPIGVTTAGLPVGVQIVGPHLHDKTTLAIAAMISEFVPPPAPPLLA